MSSVQDQCDAQADTSKLKHTCEFCGGGFATELCHRRHIWLRTARLVCCICRLRFATAKDLHRHEKFHRKRARQEWQMCPHCPFRTRRVGYLDVHILRLHGSFCPEMHARNFNQDATYSHPEPEIEMLRRQLRGLQNETGSYSELEVEMVQMQLREHRMSCAEPQCNPSTPQNESDVRPTYQCKSKHICEFCGSGFTTELYHTHHVSLRTSHLMCCICKVRFATERDIYCHEKSHSSRQGRMKCPHCPFRTFCTNLIDRHILRRHSRDSQPSWEGSGLEMQAQDRNCLEDTEGTDQSEIDGNQRSGGEFQCSFCSATDTV